jgi:hypothetical protein
MPMPMPNYPTPMPNSPIPATSHNKMKVIYGIILILCIIIVIVILLRNKINASKQEIIPIQSEEKAPVQKPIPILIQKEENAPKQIPNTIQNQGRKIPTENLNIIMPDTSKRIPNGDYTIINAVVRDYTYYRLGVKTESEFNNILLIQTTINSIIPMIKDNDIKDNLQREKPLFLIGSSAHDFLELQSLKDVKSAEGARNVLDVAGFGPIKPTPGFISYIFNKCDNPTYLDEDVVFHEFMHAIHHNGMTQKQKDVLNELYNKYNVLSNIYDIKSYAFVTVFEFFAEMAQVYCQMTFRLDVTGKITHKILKNYLPELYIFLGSILNIYPNHALIAICTSCNQDLLCCRDEYEECAFWESIGECNKNPEFMKTRCRKSCKICS